MYVIAAAILLASFAAFVYRLGTVNLIDVADFNPVIGRADAPVTLVVFGSYNCIYTGKFFLEAFPWLKQEYVDAGKMRIVYRQAPVSQDLQPAEEASLCANDQGKFWEFSSMLFENEEWKQEINTSLERYSSELGINQSAFSDCLNNHVHLKDIGDDYNYWTRLGLKKTPTLFVNGVKIDGLPPKDDLESLLSKFNY